MLAPNLWYSYVSFLSMGGTDQSSPTPYPTTANAIPVRRQQAYPLATTNGVTQAGLQILCDGAIRCSHFKDGLDLTKFAR